VLVQTPHDAGFFQPAALPVANETKKASGDEGDRPQRRSPYGSIGPQLACSRVTGFGVTTKSLEDNDMLHTTRKLVITGLIAIGLIGAAGSGWSAESANSTAMIERGRYLAQLAGCNDCHTPGYLINNGEIPESRWLIGDSFGWRGPWGTTYASNLRLFLKDMSEDAWVETARTLKRRPPMPWYTVNQMHEDDLRALYRFVRSLGEPGNPAPAYVPPDQDPTTPYALFP